MSAGSKKYYVVWTGRHTGVFTTWADCEAQVKGAAGARFKAFATRAEAEAAFRAGAPSEAPRRARKPNADNARTAGTGSESPRPAGKDSQTAVSAAATAKAWAVDAACSGNPGPMEYRCVDMATGRSLFHVGPLRGTNNIGEFLALVHALALIRREGLTGMTVYSDSRNALLWLKARKCRTKLPETAATAEVHELIRRAERWLAANRWDDVRIEKWHTDLWGEIPADFGRK
ncbi:MAG: ribonuclease H family protein [Prevotellaceae bacterium]|nr:ribonuclease H family protein [Prevotellaceae bacterium]